MALIVMVMPQSIEFQIRIVLCQVHRLLNDDLVCLGSPMVNQGNVNTLHSIEASQHNGQFADCNENTFSLQTFL